MHAGGGFEEKMWDVDRWRGRKEGRKEERKGRDGMETDITLRVWVDIRLKERRKRLLEYGRLIFRGKRGGGC